MKTITLRGNMAGDVILYNEDDIERVRGVATVIENHYNPKTEQYDKQQDFPFTVFGREALNLAETVANIKDDTGKYPPMHITCKVESYKEEGENRKGDVVDKTHLSLTMIAGGPDLRWHVGSLEEDGLADEAREARESRSGRGRSGRSGGRGRSRRRGREEEADETDDIDEDLEEDVVDEDGADEEEEEKPRRSRSSRSSSRSGGRASRSGGSARSSRTSRSSRSRSGGSRRSRGYDD